MADADPAVARRDAIIEDLDFVTDRLSTQVRQLALGVLAVVWALLVAAKSELRLDWSPVLLLALAGLSILTLLVDFLQYVAAYFASRRALDDVESGGTGQYRASWLSWRLRRWCFGAKLVVCVVTVGVFLGAILVSVT